MFYYVDCIDWITLLEQVQDYTSAHFLGVSQRADGFYIKRFQSCLQPFIKAKREGKEATSFQEGVRFKMA